MSQLHRVPDSVPGRSEAAHPGVPAAGPLPPPPAPPPGYVFPAGHVQPSFDPRTGALLARTFPGIGAQAIRDARDAGRMSRVRLLKGLDFVYSRFLNLGVEQAMAHELQSQAVRVGEEQVPELWQLLHCAARALDIRVPEIFIGRLDAGTQTIGQQRPLLFVDGGLLDLLDDDELVFALGRELGHVLLGQVSYKMLARSIGDIGEAVGNFTLNVGAMITTGLEAPLRDWNQFSEFSADRAGLLAVQRLDVAVSALLKQAGGGHRFSAGLSAPVFVEQGLQALHGERPAGARLSAIVRSLQAGAPLYAERAAALTDWYEGGDYAALLQGHYARR